MSKSLPPVPEWKHGPGHVPVTDGAAGPGPGMAAMGSVLLCPGMGDLPQVYNDKKDKGQGLELR